MTALPVMAGPKDRTQRGETALSTAPKPIAEGDRVTFTTNGGRIDATGTVAIVWTNYGTQVARVAADPNPLVRPGCHIVNVADLKPIRGAR